MTPGRWPRFQAIFENYSRKRGRKTIRGILATDYTNGTNIRRSERSGSIGEICAICGKKILTGIF
jgi:hypothetical protein